jgi:transglutaminase-like putative cysteine protease
MNARAVLWPARARARQQQRRTPLLPAQIARLLAFTALASFGALHWGRLVEPSASAELLATLAASVAAAVVLRAVAQRHPSARVRAAAMLLAAAVLLVVAFAAAGVAPRLLLNPHAWKDLGTGIGHGLSALPSLLVPYSGPDEWTRSVIVAGGATLIAAGALLAFAVRRDGAVGYPLAAAIALATLYAVAIIQRRADRPFLAGAAFALLLALFLWLERVERRSAGLAAAAVGTAVLLALVVSPRIDADRALLNYEQIAQSLSRSPTTQYDWDHHYGPLSWPRDGREVLRVRAPARAYWKAVNLVGFDGTGWVKTAERDQRVSVPPAPDRSWLEKIHVTIRALRSSQFVAAGTTLQISDSPRPSMPSAPGQFETSGQPLRRGQAYRAEVYVPRPTAAMMKAAGTAYPEELNADYGVIGLPPVAPTGEQRLAALPFWGQRVARSVTTQRDEAILSSPYARTYALAQRLRAGAANPYQYMRAIERHLRRNFAYTERPRRSAVPLAAFLFVARAGYCQQFSGAMALLLRMGGVPARVAAGFSPGVLDAQRHEYVVRDVDAHSWVEVYFPGIGWVTRDPTPAVAPARSQTSDRAVAGTDAPVTIGGAGERAAGAKADPGRAGGSGAAGGTHGPALPAEAIAAVGLLALALVGVLVLAVRRSRRERSDDEEIAELRRALERSGRAPQPHLTLEALAQRFAGTLAEGYARRLAAARYGYGADRPSRAQRAGLRRELAAGLGLRGHLRAWWALPPRARRR